MNIIVVEDTLLVRLMLVGLLKEQDKHHVVAAVESAEEALALLAQNPDVDLVVLDLCLPGISYAAAVKAIKTAGPHLEILVFTVSADDETVFPALQAGAAGYILKGARQSQILDAIDDISSGGAPMSPAIAKKVLREFQRIPPAEELKTVISPLSARETEILELLYRGSGVAQIADALCISPHTIHTHIKKIYTKLHVNSRSQAIYEAFQQKLISPAP